MEKTKVRILGTWTGVRQREFETGKNGVTKIRVDWNNNVIVSFGEKRQAIYSGVPYLLKIREDGGCV